MHYFMMKISNKTELQRIAINHLSDIDFIDFMKIYKNCPTETYSFFVNDTTLPSNKSLGFRKNLLKWIDNKIIKIDDQIKEEKLQYDINREAAKISAFSSGKINKYEYISDEKKLPSNQKQIIEQVKFNYSPLWKTNKKNGGLRK